jgi:hypothetical protein
VLQYNLSILNIWQRKVNLSEPQVGVRFAIEKYSKRKKGKEETPGREAGK